jgi:hypothetical protein
MQNIYSAVCLDCSCEMKTCTQARVLNYEARVTSDARAFLLV